MAQRFFSPFETYVDAAGAPYALGVLAFYQTNSSTPLAVYSDSGLSVSVGTSVTLNSAGRPTTAIFLQNQDYKVTLTDSSGNLIWTADPVRASDYSLFSIDKVCSGNPNSQLAGTAGSSGVLPTRAWDYTNSIMYVCTSTGSSSTAVWTAINVTSSNVAVPAPQGYLTPTSGTPVITGDSSAATAVYYTPYVGNLVPVYNGTTMVASSFAELTLTLVSSHALSSIYDVFMFSNSGVLTLATGPAWSSATAGSCSRGTGAGTTQLARLNGILTNAQSITGRNGSTTYTIAGNYGTYLGSIFIDGTAGQVSCLTAFGQSRKWGIWNAYNRQQIMLQAGDGTASWAYNTATIRAANAASSNSLTTFCGLAEEVANIQLTQNTTLTETVNGAGPTTSQVGVGVNSTTVYSGMNATFGNSAGASSTRGGFANIARHILSPSLGINTITALEKGNASAVSTFFGGNANMLLTASWRG